jgi:molybdate transport system ATP-binding protein
MMMRSAQRGLHLQLHCQSPMPMQVELHCEQNELLALVGPSGSGKSTLLRVIAGLVRPDAQARIECAGQLWFDAAQGLCLTPQQRRIGLVFQQYALFPHLSALHNVMEALGDLPAAQRASRARDWLHRLHLSGLEHRKPGSLSGGQQQRVALARALAREPQALLLDEPFSAVDRVTREKLYEELAQLRRELSMPVLLVTHDLDEALLLADRLCILHQGRTLQHGAPYEVLTRPCSAEVARLMGQKNIFRGGVIAQHAPSDSHAGATVIEWRGRALQARWQPQFAPGTQVSWTVPRSHLVLCPAVQAAPPAALVTQSMDHAGNQVQGSVASMVRLGDNAALSILVDGPSRPPLFMSVPLHQVAQQQLAPGATVALEFLAEGIHLMPGDRSPGQLSGAGQHDRENALTI